MSYFLNTGFSRAFFQYPKTEVVFALSVYRSVSGGTIADPVIFNNLGDIPSGPVDFVSFSEATFFSISLFDRHMLDIVETAGTSW